MELVLSLYDCMEPDSSRNLKTNSGLVCMAALYSLLFLPKAFSISSRTS